jgi:hypothetical protein
MDSPKPSEKIWLNSLAQMELENLQSEGVNPTWEQVAKLHILAERVECPKIQKVTATGQPSRVNGLTLWPMTIQAGEWYQWACENLKTDSLVFALIYAHTHARDLDAFGGLYDLDSSYSALKQFKSGLSCTLNEIVIAISELNGDEEGKVEDTEETDMDEVIAFLVAETGIEPEIWKSRVSIKYVNEQIRTLNAIKSEASASMKVEYIEAERALGLAIIEIKRGQ